MIEEIDADHGLFRRLSEHAVELAVAAASEKDPLARGRLERKAVDHARKANPLEGFIAFRYSKNSDYGGFAELSKA